MTFSNIVQYVANNRRVMGNQANTRALNVLGWLAMALMMVAGVAMLVSAV